MTTITDRGLAMSLELARLDLAEKLAALRASRERVEALLVHAEAPSAVDVVVGARDGNRMDGEQRK